MNARPHDDGVTLVELLVAITVMAVIGVAVLTTIVQAMRTTAEGQDRVTTLTELANAAERVAREVRAADPVVSAAATALQLEVQRNGILERHTFTAAEGGLQHRIARYSDALGTSLTTDGTSQLVPALTVPATGVFTYWQEGGDAWAPGSHDVAELARVDFSLAAVLDGQEVPYTLTTSVHLRNHEE